MKAIADNIQPQIRFLLRGCQLALGRTCLAVNIGTVQLHEAIRPRERAKSERPIEVMRVARDQRDAPHPEECWMRKRLLHEPAPQPQASMFLQDIDVTQVSESGAISHVASQPNLLASAGSEQPEAKRTCESSCHDFSWNARRPI